MKLIKGITVFCIIFIVFLGLTKDLIVKLIILKGIESLTGLDVSIKEFKFDPIKQSVDIDRAIIYNPTGFSDRDMADFSKIKIDYDLLSLLEGRIYFRELTLYLDQFVVVKDRNRQFNVDAIKSVKLKKDKRFAKTKKIKIDTLNLKIKQVIFKNYTKDPVEIRRFNLNIDEHIRDVQDGYTLVNGIVANALYNDAVRNFLSFKLDAILPDLGKFLNEAISFPLSITNDGADITKGLIDGFKKVIE